MSRPPVEVHCFPIASRDDARRRLRELLAPRLGVAPGEVTFLEDRSREAKPALDPARHGDLAHQLSFNLSHSGERGLVAIADEANIGVDIEAVQPERGAEYLRDWTRREAYLKGIGAGLGGGFRDLTFASLGDAGWSVLKAGTPVDAWTVLDLDPGPGYVAALAADSEVDLRLRFDPALR